MNFISTPSLSASDIETYRRDGVVHLKNLFSSKWIDLLRQGIARDMADPSPRFEERTEEGDSARYFEDFWVWSQIPEFEEFVRNSPAGALAGRLLEASRINLVMDNWFLREAGAASRAPWHHDIAYFDFEGTMCVLWVPLEATGRDEGIELVRGSHLWDKLFMRVWFRNHEAAQGAGWVNGSHYELPPDIDQHREQYDLISFEMEVGDCLIFDMRTLHGSPAGVIPQKTRSRFSLRMTAEDGRIRHRGDWAKGEREIFEAAGHREGDALDSDFFPRLWTAERPAPEPT